MTDEEKKVLNYETALGRATTVRFLLETSEPIIRDFQAAGGVAEVIGSRIDKRQANRQRRLDVLSNPRPLPRLFGSVPQPVEPITQTKEV